MALERAKETIYIADWWLSPELFMRRPPYYNQEWRLDQILKRKAEEGVKIYVIVYREVEVYDPPSCLESYLLMLGGTGCPDMQLGTHEARPPSSMPQGPQRARKHNRHASSRP